MVDSNCDTEAIIRRRLAKFGHICRHPNDSLVMKAIKEDGQG